MAVLGRDLQGMGKVCACWSTAGHATAKETKRAFTSEGKAYALAPRMGAWARKVMEAFRSEGKRALAPWTARSSVGIFLDSACVVSGD
jgi:hypothetical protein